jgi:hypothetical protein
MEFRYWRQWCVLTINDVDHADAAATNMQAGGGAPAIFSYNGEQIGQTTAETRYQSWEYCDPGTEVCIIYVLDFL